MAVNAAPRVAIATDIEHLMSWFEDAPSIRRWGGPNFRFPFTFNTFDQDCRWHEMLSIVLRDNDNATLAFGQVYERYQRMHLARIVTCPDYRGQGLGRRLVMALMQEGLRRFNLQEFALFVYKDNMAAIALYENVGFRRADFPKDAPLQDVCFYMTSPSSAMAAQQYQAGED